MAWNEPGGGRGNDPWGGGSNNNEGPPDLDEVVRKLQERLGSLFGGKRGGGSGGSGANVGGIGLGVILAGAAAVWGFSGLYTVDAGEQGVVLRFGSYLESTGPGLHWHARFIDSVEVLNVDQVRDVKLGFQSTGGRDQMVIGESQMLTQDENVIDVKLSVQYRIDNAADYLFNVRSPDATLAEAAESAVREIVGKSKMDYVITEGRSDIAARTKVLTQEILDRYKSGLLVTSVNMQDAQAPAEVQEAFADAIKAREDEVRYTNEAEAYAREVINQASGRSKRVNEEAKAYKESVIARAEGEAQRFTALEAEYEKAPKVTRDRLYLETMEQVLSNTGKVMVDVKGGNSVMYLPLDRMMGAREPRDDPGLSGTARSSTSTPSSTGRAMNNTPSQRPLREDLRRREVR